MLKENEVYMYKLKEEFGNDWTDIDFSGIKIMVNYSDLTEIILPKDRNFFKYLSFVNSLTLPKINLSDYDFEGVSLNNFEFSKDTILPDDTDFFQRIKDKSLRGTKLPEGKYDKYNFDGVSLYEAHFTENSTLSEDTEFFQRIKDKDVRFAILPNLDFRKYNLDGMDMNRIYFNRNSVPPNNYLECIDMSGASNRYFPEFDYSRYDFKEINLLYTKFNFNAKLPEHESFLKDVYNGFYSEVCPKKLYTIGEKSFALTMNIVENIHRYDLSGLKINLKPYSHYMTREQLCILKDRYPSEIGRNIIVPKIASYKKKKDTVATKEMTI